MSSVYISEPPTSGHVIIHTTTYGMIDIHLYCKECPTTCQYFLHLCSHNYYDDMIFHRIIHNLLIQTGVVRYNGNSDSSSIRNDTSYNHHQQQQQQQMNQYNKLINAAESYERRQYELHSRLRFSHRGQVAMALPIPTNNNNNNADDNNNSNDEMQPQFFITTDEAPYLNGKHVIFGTVVGPTIFNVMRMNQYAGGTTGGEGMNNSNTDDSINVIDVNDSSAPRIVSTKIVTNPFEHNMIPKSMILTIAPWILQQNTNGTTNTTNEILSKKKKRKGKLDRNVLSFGDEVDDTITIVVSKKQATTSTEKDRSKNNTEEPFEHDIVETQRTVAAVDTQERQCDPLNSGGNVDNVQQNSTHRLEINTDAINNTNSTMNDAATETISSKRTTTTTISAVEAHRAKYMSRKQKENMDSTASSSLLLSSSSSKQQRDDATYNKLLNFRRKLHDTVKASSQKNDTTIISHQQDDSLASRMARRAQQLADDERTKNDPDYDPNYNVPSYHGQILLQDNDDDKDPNQWLQTKFICKKHMDLLSGDNKDAMEEYVVIDPKK